MRKKIIVICSIGLFLGTFIQVTAQPSNSLYFMRGVPQSIRINPARQPECTFYFGIPALSPLSSQVTSNSLAFDDVIYPHPTEDSLITFLHPLGDKQAFLDKLKPVNLVVTDVGTTLFSIGFLTGAGFFSLDVTTRVEGDVNLPADLARLVLEGADDGRTYTLDGIGADITGFDDISVGWAGAIGKKWNIGVRGKALFGFGNLTTKRSKLAVTTSEEAWNIRSDMEVNASLPFAEVTYNEDGMIEDIIIDEDQFDLRPSNIARQAFNTKNFGLAVDLGVDFRPTDRWLISASVLDLGYIRWTDEVHKVTYNTGYDYTGLEVNPFDFSDTYTFSDFLDSSLTALGDTLADGLEFTPGGVYSSRLNTKIYIGASWRVIPQISFGLLSRTDFLPQSVHEQITATTNFSLGRIFNFTLSYSYSSSYLKNFGAGMSFNAGPLNLYLLSDNTINVLIWPQETVTANIWFGMNLVFGYNQFFKTDRDRPLIY